MKKLLFLVLFFVFSLSMKAQITWNITAGAGFSQIFMDNKNLGTQLAWTAGVMIEHPIYRNNLLIMTAICYTHKGSSYSDPENVEYNLADIDYVQIPVILAKRFNLKHINILIKGGGYGAYAINNGKNVAVTDKIDGGWLAGLDIEYRKYVIGAEYQQSCLSLKDTNDKGAYNSAVYFTLGYRF